MNGIACRSRTVESGAKGKTKAGVSLNKIFYALLFIIWQFALIENAFPQQNWEIAKDWLDAHNKYRCMHNVPAMTWSDRLAALARETAQECDCAHCNPNTKNKYYENIACDSSSPKESVDRWHNNEINNYNYSNPQWVTDGDKKTGHFIIMVAKALTEVGCACHSPNTRDCVCVYDRAGGPFFNAENPDDLKHNVFKLKDNAEAKCIADRTSYCHDCNNGQGTWETDTTQCWRIAGYPEESSGACNKCWESGNIVACGAHTPPLIGLASWTVIGTGEGAWAVGGPAPDGLANCWKLIASVPQYACGSIPKFVGIRVNDKPACWEKLDANVNYAGTIYCEY